MTEQKPNPKFVFSFSFRCSCGNDRPDRFYTMPAEAVKEDDSFGFADNIFRIVCKICKAEYRADFNVRKLQNAETR